MVSLGSDPDDVGARVACELGGDEASAALRARHENCLPVLRAPATVPARPAIGATNIEPATSQPRSLGLRTSCVSGIATYSAWLPRSCVYPYTSSPTANPVMSGAIFETTRAKSLPWPDGNVAGNCLCKLPSRIGASPGLIAALRTRNFHASRSGRWFGHISNLRTLSSPYRSNRTAFMAALFLRG